MVKLNLGAGGKRIDGYLSVDVVEVRGKDLDKTDIIADIRALPFEDNSVDGIIAVHVIEHFYKWEVQDVLKEWHRVLVPGGEIILECPDLLKALYHFVHNPSAVNLSMWALYGDPKWKDPLMVHRWAYTGQTLADELFKAGFVNVEGQPAQYKQKLVRDMRLVAQKPKENNES